MKRRMLVLVLSKTKTCMYFLFLAGQLLFFFVYRARVVFLEMMTKHWCSCPDNWK